jgi:hypothetical protein
MFVELLVYADKKSGMKLYLPVKEIIFPKKRDQVEGVPVACLFRIYGQVSCGEHGVN